MKPNEFEYKVRELRQRQRRFFNCRKDDPDRKKALELMRETEKELREVIEPVMAIRERGKSSESPRESFFLDVAEMMKRQREWAKNGGGSWQMNPAKEYEKKVDEWLRKWDEEANLEKTRKREEEAKRQTKLF